MPRVVMVLLALALSACSDAPWPPPSDAQTTAPTPSPTPTPEGFGRADVDDAMDHVRALAAEIGIREAGTEGDRLAATYISEQLDELGWDAREQAFPLPQGGGSSNVIGTPPGFDDRRPYLLVGAHRDSHRGPGANDNATGVGVMLDIARAVDEVPAPLPVAVVAFGAEETQIPRRSRIGSRFYLQQMSEGARSNLVALVNIDMAGNGDTLICGRLDEGPTEGTERCVAQAKAVGVRAESKVLPDWSDHGPFAMAGLNTAWLWTGDVACCYHNDRDTMQNVDEDDLARTNEVALAIVRSYEKG